MKLRDSVAFVTGANRGIGLVFTQERRAETADISFDFATDTFIVQNGKIVTQTFAGKSYRNGKIPAIRVDPSSLCHWRLSHF